MIFPRPTTKQELMSDLSAIDAYYKPSVSDFEVPDFSVLLLDKLTFTMPSDATITAEATSSADAKIAMEKDEKLRPLRSGKAACTAAYSAAEIAWNNKLAALNLDKADELAAVDTKLSAKGMAVSSVAANLKEQINKKYARLQADGEAELAALLSKTNVLKADYEDNISKIELYYTTYRQNYIDSEKARIKAEYTARNDVVVKQNNDCKAREVASLNNWQQATARLNLSAANYITTGYSTEKLDALGFYADKLTVIRSYYSTFTALNAYTDFADTNDFIRHLGKYYYETLYEMYKLAKASV